MSLIWYLPLFIIYIFGVVNLLGIRPDLVSRQLLFFGVGLVIFFIIRKINIHFFRLNATFFYWVGIALLLFTYLIGFEVKGSTRWIDLYVFQLQSSELFKIFFMVFMANLLSSIRSHTSHQSLFLLSLGATLLPFILIFKQPDLGSALIVFAIFFVMILHSPVKKSYLFYFFIFVLALLPVFWFTLHDYQKHRIYTFINHEQSTSATSYNMEQAIIAVGSGNTWGKGLGFGKQSQLSFLPEYHTDFAFSSLIEQFGFMGGSILLLLYLIFFFILFYRLVRIIRRKDELSQFQFYYTIGFSALIIAQTCINIGMNVGLLPIAGITLPFVSYGGSSLLTFMIALALLP
ncbi:rod shape-determining protein RodA [soil metagenome]